jgi:hypothetical protein
MISLRTEMKTSLIAAGIAAMAFAAGVLAQGGRDASPIGTAATQVGGHYEHVVGIVDPVCDVCKDRKGQEGAHG